MSDKTDYVMLPPKRGSAARKPLRIYAIFGFLLVVVAAVSWWVGQSSKVHNDNPNAEIKQVPPNLEQPSDPQLASATPPAAATDVPSSNPPLSTASVDPPTSAPIPKPSPGILAKGGVTIRSIPDGAVLEVVNMDNAAEKRAENTPATLTKLPIGFYDMTIVKPGYKPYTGTVEVVPNKVRELAPIELIRSTGQLDILTSKAATWELHTEKEDGSGFELVAQGEAPGNAKDLPTKAYRLTLNRKAWPAIVRNVTVVENLTTEVKHDYLEGEIKIGSTPEGVEVWLKPKGDEASKQLGVTPLLAPNLPIGEYEVVLKPLEGKDKQLLVKVEADKVADAFGSWAKSAVQVTSDPPGAAVFYGSTRLFGEGNFGETPFKTMMMEGEHELRAVKDGLTDVPMKVLVVGNQNNNAHFAFQHGAVRISTTPNGAEVFIGKKSLGKTPIMIPHMKPGEYAFQMSRERYSQKTVTERVRAGRQLDLNVTLNYDPLPDEGEDFTNSVSQRMKWVPELKGWAEATETSQAAFTAIMNKNPSQAKGNNLPVTNVSWNDAMKYCEQLTLSDRGQGLVPTGYRYILPTDAQWTILAGKATLTQAVTSQGKTREGPAPMASLEPNELGLHDIRGNVWEWCFDWYTQEVYNREQRENASGKLSNVGTRAKILRGGSWNRSLKSQLEVGYRFVTDPAQHQNWESGFRVLLTPDSAGR